MPKIPPQAVHTLAESLGLASGRAAAALKREFLAAYGISPSTLSRLLTEIGVRSHERADLGTRRKPVNDDSLRAVAFVQASSHSQRKGVMMPAKDALDIAEQNGIIEPGSVDPSYYNRWLRDQEGSRTDQATETPHTSLRSLGPNHVHQVDFSLAINWKLSKNKIIYEDLIYKNKPVIGSEPRLWRFMLVDHTTGAFFPHYTANAGETVPALIEGLYRAWTTKLIAGKSVQDRYPFRGVPRILMADRGASTRSGITVSLLKRLDVELNICEGPRSKGTVECQHRWWEERFESRFRVQGFESIDQLNDWAVDFAARVNAEERHSRTGSTRSRMWEWFLNRRHESTLREIQCDFDTFKMICLTEPQQCKVSGARIIRYRALKYRVPLEVVPGSTVLVQFSPFSYPQITVRLNENQPAAWACDPIQVDEFGFAAEAPVIGQEYKSQPHTKANNFARDAKRGSKDLLEANKLQAFGYHIDKIKTSPTGVKPASEELPLAPTADVTMSKVRARQSVIDLIGRAMTPAEAAHVSQLFGEQVTEAEIAAAVNHIQQGIAARVFAFPGAVGAK